MANWCSNYISIEVDETASDFPKYLRVCKLFMERANFHNQKFNQGMGFFMGYVFNAYCNDEDFFTDFNVETKWSEVDKESTIKFVTLFECIESVTVNFYEPGSIVAGEYYVTKRSGSPSEILISEKQASKDYWILEDLRQLSEDVQLPNMEVAVEESGYTEDEIYKALALARMELSDFDGYSMECFDYDDFLEPIN